MRRRWSIRWTAEHTVWGNWLSHKLGWCRTVRPPMGWSRGGGETAGRKAVQQEALGAGQRAGRMCARRITVKGLRSSGNVGRWSTSCCGEAWIVGVAVVIPRIGVYDTTTATPTIAP